MSDRSMKDILAAADKEALAAVQRAVEGSASKSSLPHDTKDIATLTAEAIRKSAEATAQMLLAAVEAVETKAKAQRQAIESFIGELNGRCDAFALHASDLINEGAELTRHVGEVISKINGIGIAAAPLKPSAPIPFAPKHSTPPVHEAIDRKDDYAPQRHRQDRGVAHASPEERRDRLGVAGQLPEEPQRDH